MASSVEVTGNDADLSTVHTAPEPLNGEHLDEQTKDNAEVEGITEGETQMQQTKGTITYREWYERLKDHAFNSRFALLGQVELDFLCGGDTSDFSNPVIEKLITTLDSLIEEVGGDALARLDVVPPEYAILAIDKLSSEEKDRIRIQVMNQVELDKQLATANVRNVRGTFTRRLVSQGTRGVDEGQPSHIPRSALKPEAESPTYEAVPSNEPLEAVVLRAFGRVCAERMRVSSGKEALSLLTSSSNVRYRLKQMRDANGTRDSGVEVCIVVQQWSPELSRYPGMHLRGFVFDNSLNALSQINNSTFFPYLVQHKITIQQRVETFFKNVVSEKLADIGNYVIDVFVGSSTIAVTDVLPFEKSTGACLFTWRENEELFKHGPLEFRVFDRPAEDNLPSLPSRRENELLKVVAELKKLTQEEEKSCIIL